MKSRKDIIVGGFDDSLSPKESLPQDRNERLPAGPLDRQAVEHLHRYAVAQSRAPGLDVLDIACGEGYGSNLLSQVARKVVGVDVDAAAVDRAKQKYQRGNLSFLHGSGAKIPLPDNSFDLVVSFETLEHLVEHEEMLGELKRVLRPGGLMIISTPDKSEYTDKTGHLNPYHVRELYTDEFLSLVGRYFKHLTLYKQGLLLNSVIVQANEVASPLEIFSGDMGGVLKLANPAGFKFNILLASNQAPVAINNCLFDGQSALDDLVSGYYQAGFLKERLAGLDRQMRDLQSSHSFRLGQALTAPLRWLRRN